MATLTAKHKPYSVYKSSGIEWLRDVPAHWEVRRLKTLCSMKSGDGISAISIEPIGEYPVYGGNGLRGYTSLCNHDGTFVLIGRQGALCGNVYVARGKFWATEHAVVATLALGHEIGWFSAILTAMNLNQYSFAAAQPGLAVERIMNLHLPLPPLAEQRAIAAFLDRKTAKIDALVSKKERLIELLQEKRTALISRTVTKGLNPKAQLKNSGVEWLGEIPEHWEIRRASQMFSIGSGTTPPSERSEYYGGNIPWVTTSELRETIVTSTEKNITEEALRTFPALEVFPEGSIAVAMYGATIGRIGILGVPATVNQACCVFSEPNGLIARYWFYWLQSRRHYLIVHGQGGGQSNLSQKMLRSLRVTTPPLSEQETIVAFLDRETTKLDNLIAKVHEAIELLKELRTALISAAVTGKIDVREEMECT